MQVNITGLLCFQLKIKKMKENLHFSKSAAQRFCFLFALTFLCANWGFGQQVIGEFPVMDGGMEGQSAGTISTAGSSSAGSPQTEWTVSSSSNSAQRLMFDDSTLARTGRMFATSALAASATNVRVQSPSSVAPDTLLTNTDYTIQYFYKTNTDPIDYLDGGIYLNNTSGGRTADIIPVPAFVAGQWTKGYCTRTTNTTFNESNWAVARISPGGSGIYLDTIAFDDFVVYAGDYDSLAPDAPMPLTPASEYSVNGTSADVEWVAPATGEDGGGYVVLKYDTMPNADNDPNQNGIYAVGNTTSNGTGSLLGTVVYIGTGTSFSDTYTAGAYYKVYTVDKAFNYSDEITLSEEVMIGISEVENSAISVYPNPVQHSFSINSKDITLESASLFSIDGAKVLTQDLENGNVMDVSTLPQGVYILKMKSSDKVYTQKIAVE